MSFIRALAYRTGISQTLRLHEVNRLASASPAQQVAPSCFISRKFSTLTEHQSEVDEINDKFVEARDEIEYAAEDAETVYFNESCDAAKALVQEVLDKYQGLLQKLSADEKGKLERSMGLKMEQLKAEVAQLDALHAD